MKHLAKRSLSLLMTVLMVLSLVPAAPHAHAATYGAEWEYGVSTDGNNTPYDWLQGAFKTADTDYIYEEGQAYDWAVTLTPTLASATVTVDAKIVDGNGAQVAVVSKNVEVAKTATTTLLTPADFPDLGDKLGDFTLSVDVIFNGNGIAWLTANFARTGAAGNGGNEDGWSFGAKWTYKPGNEWLTGEITSAETDFIFEGDKPYDWTVTLCPTKGGATVDIEATIEDEAGNVLTKTAKVDVTQAPSKTVIASYQNFPELTTSVTGKFKLTVSVYLNGTGLAKLDAVFGRTSATGGDQGGNEGGDQGGNEGGDQGGTQGGVGTATWTFAPTYDWLEGHFNTEATGYVYGAGQPYDWTVSIKQGKTNANLVVDAFVLNEEGGIIASLTGKAVTAAKGQDSEMLAAAELKELTGDKLGNFILVCTVKYLGEPVAELVAGFARTGVVADAEAVPEGTSEVWHKSGNSWINGKFNHADEDLVYEGDQSYDWTFTVAPTLMAAPGAGVYATVKDAEGNLVSTCNKTIDVAKTATTTLITAADFPELTKDLVGTFTLYSELSLNGTVFVKVSATFTRTPVVYEDNVQYANSGENETYEWLAAAFDGSNADSWGVSVNPAKQAVTANVTAKLLNKDGEVVSTVTKENVECGKTMTTWLVKAEEFTELSGLYGDLVLICDIMNGTNIVARVTKNFTRSCDHTAEQETVAAQDPTCNDYGRTEGKKCSACGEMTVPQQPISRLTHKMEETEAEVPAACEEPGKTAVLTCANGCGKTEGGDPIEKLGHVGEANCDEHVCSRCGAQIGFPLGHEYDADNKCTRCGKYDCENGEFGAEHKWADATCTAPKTCQKCQATEGEANGHTPGADDGDCTTAITCAVCGTATTPGAASHTPNTDDGDCTTAITCSVCGKETTPAAAAHTPNNDDGDCTTAITCSVCGKETTPAAAAHTPNNDDGDCTTAITCSVCGKETTPAAAAHTPNTDDGDCTTAITCSVCGKETTPAAAAHTPNNDDGDCTTAITCSICGKETTPAKEHDWNPATLTTPKTCKNCGKTEGDVATCNHTWDEGKVTTEPTCTAEGVKTFTCSACSATKTEKVDALTHNMQQTAAEIPATCGVPGKTAVLTCANGCGKTDGGVEIPALEHNMVETAAAVPATCVAPGKTAVQACANEGCNVIYGGEDVKPLDHAYTGEGGKCVNGCGKTKCGNEGHDWADATCTAPKTCKVCQATEGAAAGHDWADATCTTPKTCKVCQATEGAAAGHDWADATCTTPKTCKVCQATEGEVADHEWIAATTTTPKTCKNCGKTEGGLAECEHDWAPATCTTLKTCKLCKETEGKLAPHDMKETSAAVEATCEAAGKTAVLTCAVCGKTEGGEEIAKLAHTEETLAAVAATCTKTGLTEGKKCSVCGTVTVKQEVVEKLAHTEETLAAVAATCTKTGLTEGKKCSVCGTVTVKQKVVEKLAHTEETVAGKAATCTEAGLTDGKKCSVCGTVTVAQKEIPAEGHHWIAATLTTPKTCKDCGLTEGGVATCQHEWIPATCTTLKTCKLCNETEGKLAPHDMKETAAAVEATCEAAGKTAVTTCSACGHTEGGEEIPALGHNFQNGTCANCGKQDGIKGDADGNGKVNLRDAILVLKAINGGNAVDDAFADFNGDGKVNLKDAILILKEANKK